MRPAHPLRAVTPAEERALQQTVKATSERLDVVKRAQALLAVKAGKGYTEAAREAGYTSGDSISQLVERFNQHGLEALHIAAGRGRKVTSTPTQRERIIQALKRTPDRNADTTATWSLKTLERALRKASPAHSGQDDDPRGAAGGRLSRGLDAHLVSHWHGYPRAQSGNGAGARLAAAHEKNP